MWSGGRSHFFLLVVWGDGWWEEVVERWLAEIERVGEGWFVGMRGGTTGREGGVLLIIERLEVSIPRQGKDPTKQGYLQKYAFEGGEELAIGDI